ncbi:thioredoxin reductase (NADPH)/alkyl hydroperoxide reductase subunit F [Streptomyces sp. KhCrAH-43]|uniref:FAD-dependent oxidoreductase n=1 Tax=unclassified Streptomyces TaxID=2593676 RepID=UPI0003738664|nr:MULTISPECIES: FAD-dependent oxidoreductase [unclassified Streptomyces]MYS37187.1 FAD-dependent oxidoreductase [Streptomyces sp. SID4920]MYX67208.1 FAD-dependent oxidoreductase [Streptomyces sp. SID8373]RAJ44024.1 thioredoxin reductase (NADPH)/alkyl hydroperoxide reductase subunit F [Streptomyces sp. KhCrAH-43]
MSTPRETDVLVVGAGPSGVAAAVMAASLNLRTVVVEAGAVGGKLHAIGALENVPGNWSTGPQHAEALAADLDRLQQAGRCSVMQGRAASVTGYDDRAELVLEDGRTLRAQLIVVATGVAALAPPDADWISAPAGLSIPPLWRTRPADLSGRTYVLGGDRPLGTWLRTHPHSSTTLHVLCPSADEYKIAEVAGDERVRIVPVSHVVLSPMTYGDEWSLQVTDRQGERKSYVAKTVLNNLGNTPAGLDGLASSEDGYCPPGKQHPRIRVAGDLRSAQFQRVTTAQGSGAEAVLAPYYASVLKPG